MGESEATGAGSMEWWTLDALPEVESVILRLQHWLMNRPLQGLCVVGLAGPTRDTTLTQPICPCLGIDTDRVWGKLYVVCCEHCGM